MSSVQPVPFRTLFPWYCDPKREVDLNEWQTTDDDFDTVVQEPEQENPSVGLTSSFGIMGSLHIIHNAANGLLDAIPDLDEVVTDMTEVCDLLTTPATKSRVMETCFNGVVGKQFHRPLTKFNAQIYIYIYI